MSGGAITMRDATRADLADVVRLILADSLIDHLEAGTDEGAARTRDDGG
jgi:hypothetical protein